MKSEVVLEFPAVSQGNILGAGVSRGEEGGETPGGPRTAVEIEGVAGVRKARRRCARKVVGVCILCERSAREEVGRINCFDICNGAC